MSRIGEVRSKVVLQAHPKKLAVGRRVINYCVKCSDLLWLTKNKKEDQGKCFSLIIKKKKKMVWV